MTVQIQQLIFGLVQAIGGSVVALLALLIGFCVVFTLPKLRSTSRKSLVVKSLDERVGEPIHFIPATAPHGTVDQLAVGTGHRAAT